MSKVIHLNDSNFDQTVNETEALVLVDFSASWCGPCKALSPVIEKVADEWDGKAKICKVDIDEAPESAAKFKVRGVPTIILFKSGKQVATHVGMIPKEKLTKLLESP